MKYEIMDFDYVKRRQSAARASQQKLKRIIFCLTLLILLALIILSYHLLQHTHHQSIAPALKTKTTQTTKKNIVAIKQSDTSETQFDFYSVLPKMAVSVQDKMDATTTPQAASVYFLQVASFPNREDAETFKSHLADLGFKVLIKSFQGKNGLTWNRLYVGPYPTLDQAESVQKQLHNSGITGILIKPSQG